MLGIFHLLAQALAGFAAAMLLPALVAWASGEAAAGRTFLAVAFLLGFLSGAAVLALRGRVRRLDRVAGFMLVVLVWTVPPLIAAVPVARIAGVDYVTALFEAVSGYTTTGASALPGVGPLGVAGNFFRAELQWLGGLMTLATVVAVIAPGGLGGVSPVGLGTGAESPLDRMRAALRQVAGAYLVVTLLCIGLLLTTSIPRFEAVSLALATVSTGGFMPVAGDFSAWNSPLAEVVVAVFMLVGATSIVWHRMIVEGRWAMVAGHRESYWVIGIALAAGLLYAFAFAAQNLDSTVFSALRQGLFTGASLVSTTGFSPHPGSFGALPMPLVLILALIGGAAFSTAGGIRYFRVGGMLALSLQELRRLVYPHSVRRAAPDDFALTKAIWSSLAASLLVVALAALLIASATPDFEAALTAAVSAFANIGPLYASGWPEADWPAWSAWSAFDAPAKLVLIVTMILGRFEVLVLFGALNLAYWRS